MFHPRCYSRGLDGLQYQSTSTSPPFASCCWRDAPALFLQSQPLRNTHHPDTLLCSYRIRSQSPTCAITSEDGGASWPSTSVDWGSIATSTIEDTQTYTTTYNGSDTYTSSAVTLDNENTVAEDVGVIGGANHNHGILHGLNLMINDGNWRVDTNGNITGGQTEAFAASGAHMHLPHQHIVNVGNHQHSVTIPSHFHNVTIPEHFHTVNVPSHTHRVNIPPHSHSIDLPDHTHDIEFGIHQGETAREISIRVDGNLVPIDMAALDNIDIRQFLRTDGGGRILRGAFHRIEIVPDRMTRISAMIFLSIFTNSRRGGIS